MGRLRFYLVDVFAEEKYTGNQLAVVRGAQALSDAEMQRIAKEMNYSETAFILSESPRMQRFLSQATRHWGPLTSSGMKSSGNPLTK
jgi:PhzF family phenazine biosynthesis protein